MVIFALGTIAVILFLVLMCVLSLIGKLFFQDGTKFYVKFLVKVPVGFLFIGGILITGLAVGGSLYYSEGMGLVPCALCWFQRIFMYPQLLIWSVGFWRKDYLIWRYILGLSLIGFSIAIYQTYIQLTANAFAPCDSLGVTCSAIDVSYFGFVTIPVMSAVSFALSAVLALLVKSKDTKS